MLFSAAKFIDRNLKNGKLPALSPEELKFDESSLKLFDDQGPIDSRDENLSPNDVETVVSLLTQFLLFPDSPETDSFVYEGMEYLYQRLTEERGINPNFPPLTEEEIKQAKRDVITFQQLKDERKKHELTDELIVLVVKLAPYHNINMKTLPPPTIPNQTTVENIRKMTQRSFKFLSSFQNLNFSGHFSNDSFDPCQSIINDTLPYTTDKHLIDLTSSTSSVPSQTIVYHSIIRHLLNLNQSLTFHKIYIFNSRFGNYWELDTSQIPSDLIETIKSLW